MTAALTCTVSSFAIATAAAAQEAPQSAGAISQADTEATTPDDSAERAIVVTGSRIARRDFVSESPIVTVGQEQLASTGSATIEQGLNQLPQIAASAGANSSRNSRAGQANVNLRGLGQQRTLVLLDGRRMQPSGSDGTVDLNLIPAALIDNIEVITGGASSTYGSDAVAGVVNLKLKKQFTGVQLDVSTGATFKGDGATNSIGVTVGADFDDKRGNAFVSFNYSQRDLVRFIDRDYLTGQLYSTNVTGGLITAVSSNLPSQAAVNSVFASYGVAAGAVPRSSTFSLNPDGTLFVETGAVNFRSQGQGSYGIYNNSVYSVAGNDYLAQVPLTRYNFFGHADYEIADGLSVFIDGLFTSYHVTNQGPPLVVGSVSSSPVSIPVSNPFISPDLRAVLASRPNPNADFLLAQLIPGTGKRTERDEYNVFQVTGGIDGKVGGTDITWNVYGSYGESKLLARLQNYPSSVAVNTLVRAADGGRSICPGGYNFVDINSLSQGCISYIRREARNVTEIKQTVVEANAQGGLFDLPAGSVRFAVGADYRHNAYAYSPDALITTGELANFLPIFPSSGSESVKEVYGELLVPVLHDIPLIREFNINLGYRYSDYRVAGPVSTYKLDADWSVTSFLRLRGGYARAVRAPSVGELYAASTTGLVALGAPGSFGSGDPCDVRGAYRSASNPAAAQVRALCLAQGIPASSIDTFQNIVSRTPFLTSGNVNLAPEISDTYSAGVVVRSTATNPLFSRFSLSIDYYNISLDHAIGVVTNLVATSQCFGSASNPTLSNSNYYCGLMSRDPNTGQISNILNPSLNLGGYRTAGIDIAADWKIPLDAVGLGANAGTLSLSSIVSYLDKFEIQTLAGGARFDYAGTIGNQQIDFFATAHPRWKATTTVNWAIGPADIGLRWRFLDKMTNAANVGTGGTQPGVEAVSYFDLDMGVDVSKAFELRAGIVNLLDRDPPTIYTSPIGNTRSDPYTYDILGRRFYVNAKVRF
jgi:outer membrane receptor protein involved in Fe transport